MILQSLAGLPAFLVYFCTALVAVILYLFVYTRITPHDEFKLIRDNIPGAAISLGLSLLGFTLPVVSAMTHAANVIDCLIWSAIALSALAFGAAHVLNFQRTVELLWASVFAGPWRFWFLHEAWQLSAAPTALSAAAAGAG